MQHRPGNKAKATGLSSWTQINWPFARFAAHRRTNPRQYARLRLSLHQKLLVFPPLAGKTCLMFVVFECADLADMLSLWCCNPVTKYVLYLLLRIHFLASVALNYNHFSLVFGFFFFLLSAGSGAGGGDDVKKNNKFINTAEPRLCLDAVNSGKPPEFLTFNDIRQSLKSPLHRDIPAANAPSSQASAYSDPTITQKPNLHFVRHG